MLWRCELTKQTRNMRLHFKPEQISIESDTRVWYGHGHVLVFSVPKVIFISFFCYFDSVAIAKKCWLRIFRLPQSLRSIILVGVAVSTTFFHPQSQWAHSKNNELLLFVLVNESFSVYFSPFDCNTKCVCLWFCFILTRSNYSNENNLSLLVFGCVSILCNWRRTKHGRIYGRKRKEKRTKKRKKNKQ